MLQQMSSELCWGILLWNNVRRRKNFECRSRILHFDPWLRRILMKFYNYPSYFFSVNIQLCWKFGLLLLNQIIFEMRKFWSLKPPNDWTVRHRGGVPTSITADMKRKRLKWRPGDYLKTHLESKCCHYNKNYN